MKMEYFEVYDIENLKNSFIFFYFIYGSLYTIPIFFKKQLKNSTKFLQMSTNQWLL